MEKRSESDIVAKAPIKVRLGAKDYQIPVLTILPTRDWRVKLNDALADIAQVFKDKPAADANAVSAGLTGALIAFPEKVLELVFAYAGDSLPHDEIVNDATEEQLAIAFSGIMGVAYPFLTQLSLVNQVMRSQSNQPQSAKSMN